MYYVTMIDNFMSGWGRAEGMVNVLEFECNSLQEAEIVASNARARDDMEDVQVVVGRGQFDSDKYYVQTKNKESYPSWYIKNYFNNDRI